MKVHRSHWLRPREIDVLPQPLGSGNTILQSSFIEHVGREFGETRVHSVLDLETDWSIPEEDQSFEKGLVQAGFGSFLIHDRRT